MAGIPGTSGSHNGPATSATFKKPAGVAIYGTSIYISDAANYVVRAINSSCYVSDFAGTSGTGACTGAVASTCSISNLNLGGQALSATLPKLANIAFDNTTGDLYIAGKTANVVLKVDTNGIITDFAGDGSYTASYVWKHGGLATSAAITAPNTVAFDPNGSTMGITTSSPQTGGVYTVDTSTTDLRLWVGTGVSASGGNPDGSNGTTSYCDGCKSVALGPNGNFYYAELNAHAVRTVDQTTGLIYSVAGILNNYTCHIVPPIPPNSTAADQICMYPDTLAFDNYGNLYIGDSTNSYIYRVPAPVSTDISLNTIQKIAGTGTAGYSGDNGSVYQAAINGVDGIGFDSSNNMYIVDAVANTVRVVIWPF